MRSTDLAAFLGHFLQPLRSLLGWTPPSPRLSTGGEIENPRQRGCLARVSRRSVLARQVDYPVGEIQRDFIQRKIGVLDLLGEHDVAVAIVARHKAVISQNDFE